METLRRYNRALLDQRQVLSMPKYTPKGPKAAMSEFNSFFRDQGLLEREDFVSLDPCSCLPVCPPRGVGWLLNLPSLKEYNKGEDKIVEGFDEDEPPPSRVSLKKRLRFNRKRLGRLFLASIFAMLPAASILVLYVIPTSHKRLWAILGESFILVCALTMWKTESSEKETQKLDIIMYMVGIASVQVIFVGSVIGS